MRLAPCSLYIMTIRRQGRRLIIYLFFSVHCLPFIFSPPITDYRLPFFYRSLFTFSATDYRSQISFFFRSPFTAYRSYFLHRLPITDYLFFTVHCLPFQPPITDHRSAFFSVHRSPLTVHIFSTDYLFFTVHFFPIVHLFSSLLSPVSFFLFFIPAPPSSFLPENRPSESCIYKSPMQGQSS